MASSFDCSCCLHFVVDWHLFACFITQKYVATKSYPAPDWRKIKTKEDWRNLPDEEKERLRQYFRDLHNRMLQVVKDMPSSLLLISRYVISICLPIHVLTYSLYLPIHVLAYPYNHPSIGWFIHGRKSRDDCATHWSGFVGDQLFHPKLFPLFMILILYSEVS